MINYSKGLDWFCELYEGIAEDLVGADINPMYYLDSVAIDRILEYDKDVKVILGVRDPVDFAISLYGNMKIHGLNVPPILDVIKGYEWPLTPSSDLPFSLINDFMINGVSKLCEIFGDNLLIYDFKCFNESPWRFLKAIEVFLGLESFFDQRNYENIRINASGWYNFLKLNSVFANQKVLNVIYAILPQQAICYARKVYENLSVTSKHSSIGSSVPITDHDVGELGAYFANDRKFYEELFISNPIQLGSGLPV